MGTEKPKPTRAQYVRGCLILFLVGIVACTAIATCGDSEQEGKAEPEHATAVHKTGEPVKVGYMHYTVHKSRWVRELPGGDRPNARYLLVVVSVTNEDKEARSIPPFHLVDENGAEYDSTHKLLKDEISFLDSLNPAVKKDGFALFDVPPERTYKLKLSGGFWSKDTALVELLPTEE